MYNRFKEFFSFSKRELNGLLVFCILLVLVAVAPFIYSFFVPAEVYHPAAFAKEIEAFEASAIKRDGKTYRPFSRQAADAKEFNGQLFEFNPNNLPSADWERLGLSPKQINVIKNFESKGGRFYKKEDLRKIYSITPGDYARLEPFIHIPEREDHYRHGSPRDHVRKFEDRPVLIVDLNLADSVELERLNGIGPAFASRIIKYRNRLGGFHKKEQLREVYGIDSLIYQKLSDHITVSSSTLRQIPVNSATFEDLKKHPYLSYKQMNAIIQYRKQHGNYRSIEDMKPIALLNADVLKKIGPYLSFNPK